MDERYRHPNVTLLWSPGWAYLAWQQIEQAVARGQAACTVIPRKEAAPIWERGINIDDREIHEIQLIEARIGHDVAAFVQRMRVHHGPEVGRWIHYGITSSDVVDTAQAMRFLRLQGMLMGPVNELQEMLNAWSSKTETIIGRTHGQVAEPMTLGHRASHWLGNLEPALSSLMRATGDMQIAKIAGPVGDYKHSPREVERSVALDLKLRHMGTGASQITPRFYLARWAWAAATVVEACSKIALDLRLMDLLGEAYQPQPNTQVGSSSMAHKRNPIRAEKIAGMARLAAGYANMLQPLDLWLERDISNSCVERVAVPDLWHVLFHALSETTSLLGYTRLNRDEIDASWEKNRLWAQVSERTNMLIQMGTPVEDARKQAVHEATEGGQ